MKNRNELLESLVNLSFKMRLFKARKAEDKFKLKEREILILELIDKHPGIIVGDIGAYFEGVSLSTISIDLKRLRKLGLVDKSIDFNDERKFCFKLTKEGTSQIKKLQVLKLKMFQPIIDAIGNDPKEVEVIYNFVQRTIEQINLLSEQK